MFNLHDFSTFPIEIEPHTTKRKLKTALHTFLFILLSLWTFQLNAAHIVGGEMYYEDLGNNNYRVHVIIYRDCNSPGAAYDDPLTLGVFVGSTLQSTIQIPFPGSTVLPLIFSNPCNITNPNVCTQKAEYIQDVQLPAISQPYQLVYQRCCRTSNVTNITTPDDYGLTLFCFIPPKTQFAFNTSARFNNYPPLVICNNDNLQFDHSAFDPDGDSLVYSLVTPYHGGASGNPQPVPPAGPPYTNIAWQPNHSANLPFGPGSFLGIDPQTGFMIGQPFNTGLYAVGVQVDEYRNGVLINTTVRDFLFLVIQCQFTLNALLPGQTQLPDFEGYCNGLDVNFENYSSGGTSQHWDFGVPHLTDDTSNVFEPSYTYPSNGQYLVTLVTTNGTCTDTAYMNVIVNEPVTVDFEATDSICIVNNSVDFHGSVVNHNNGTLSWVFGPDATPNTAGNTLDYFNVVYNQPGLFPVKFEYNSTYCQADTTKDIYLFPKATANFNPPFQYECDGLSIAFENHSTDALSYHWDFGISGTLEDTSDQFEPTFSYNQNGFYTTTLIAYSSPGCEDTATFTFEVFKDVYLEIQSVDSMCISDNVHDYLGIVHGPDISTYSWDFGSHGSPQFVSDTNAYQVALDTSGYHTITLYSSYLDCLDSITKEIFVYALPTIDFDFEYGFQCYPYLSHFYDGSSADSEIHYLWDFGNGQTSSEMNPSMIYTQAGTYPITLTIWTTEGCVDTLTLVKDNIEGPRPEPISHFTTSDLQLDVCDRDLKIVDLSTDVKFIHYNIDQNFYPNADSLFSYQFTKSGLHHVIQIIENEYQCVDSSEQELFVDAFYFYVPNTFTPNGDEYNNSFGPEMDQLTDEWHMRIYDRWGNLLFESFDQAARWDGSYKNKSSPDGIYSYIIEMIACGDEDKYRTVTGHVALLR